MTERKERGRPPHADVLTPAEWRIAEAVRHRMSNPEIARRQGVTHPTALKNIARLRREGLVTARPYRGLFLTEAGRKLADAVRARHRLVVDLLIAVGAPREAAEADAEGMEHHVSKATLKAFERFLADQPEKAGDRPDQVAP